MLSGDIVVLTDFMASYREMMKHFKVADRDVSGISSDIFNFPIYNEDGSMDYFASVFVIRTLYKGNEEVARVRQYLQEHWLEPYDSTQIANLARLSKSHFSKLFKNQVGVTPYQYYIDLKINNLKAKLLEPNLSVAQAFAECNLDYNGHYAKLFREKVGFHPRNIVTNRYRSMKQVIKLVYIKITLQKKEATSKSGLPFFVVEQPISHWGKHLRSESARRLQVRSFYRDNFKVEISRWGLSLS